MTNQHSTILDELAKAIGVTAVMKLTGLHGGGSLYIPQLFDKASRLIEIIGEEKTLKLIKSFGGETLHLPVLSEFTEARTVAITWALHLRGHSYRQIGLILDMDHSTVALNVHKAKKLKPVYKFRSAMKTAIRDSKALSLRTCEKRQRQLARSRDQATLELF